MMKPSKKGPLDDTRGSRSERRDSGDDMKAKKVRDGRPDHFYELGKQSEEERSEVRDRRRNSDSEKNAKGQGQLV